MGPDDLSRRLAELADSVERLAARVESLESIETRVAGLERRAPSDTLADDAAVSTADELELTSGYSNFFTHVAVVCFALVGALVLRVATQQEFIAPAVGTGLGLAYCALLLGGFLLPGGAGRAARRFPALQLCSVLLAPVMVLETFHLFDMMGPAVAAVSLGVTGLAGAGAGALTGRKSLSGTALFAASCGTAGLGVGLEGFEWRIAGLGALAVAGMFVAGRRNWGVLRAAVLIPVSGALAGAVLYVAYRPEYAGVVPVALGGVAAVWAAVAVSQWRRSASASIGESVWFPLVSLWALGLVLYGAPTVAVWCGLFAALLLFIGVAVRTGAEGWSPGLASLAAGAGGVSALSLPWLPGGGPALVLAALVLLQLALRADSSFVVALSAVLALVVIGVTVLASDSALLIAGAAASTIFWGAAGGGVLLVHYRLGRRADESNPGGKLANSLALVSLFLGVVLCYLVLRQIAFLAAGPGVSFQVAQTVLLAITCVALLLASFLLRIPDLYSLGLVAVVFLGGKVVLLDLFSLQGVGLLVSVLSLGLASAVASLAIRKCAKQQGDRPGGPTTP